MGLINAFPQYKKPTARRVELCRFTSSGTFDPAQYPTEDGLYDVYIVGGGGARYQVTHWNGFRNTLGGGGGYCKLLKDLSVTGNVAVVIGAAGTETNDTGTMSGTSGGATKFGSYSVAGGSAATKAKGGDGGCGGAGINGLMGGIDGGNGSYGQYVISSTNTLVTATDSIGVGGGSTDYTPRNPYDGEYYGVGGNGSIVCAWSSNELTNVGGTAPTNYNAGRGGGYYAEPLPGICIIYGKPLGGEI